MILFWVICALLIVIALAFVLPPLLQRETAATALSDDDRKEANIAIYRDQLEELRADLDNGIVSQQQYEEDSEEIERRLLEDASAEQTFKSSSEKQRSSAYVIALAVPLVAVVFYLNVGTPQSLSGSGVAPIDPSSVSAGPRTPQQIQANVEKLAERLKTNPNDAEGWVMLARSYNSMSRFGEAAGAYAKATELKPNDAELWAEYAFVTAMANDRKIDAKAMELINQALKVDPDNVKALQLAGTAAFDGKDYKKAIEIWQRVLSRVPPGSEVAQVITERITEAKTLSVSK